MKELLRTEQIPQSAFIQDEEIAMYFFMLSKLRRCHYPIIGLKENDYYGLTDEKKLKIASSLTEEQKTIIRRDYLYDHLTGRTNTVADEKGSMLLAFSKQHLPEKAETIVNTHKEEYGKKNARLDERIAELKKTEKKAKAKSKGEKTEQTAKAAKHEKADGKAIKKGKTAKQIVKVAERPKAEAVAV